MASEKEVVAAFEKVLAEMADRGELDSASQAGGA